MLAEAGGRTVQSDILTIQNIPIISTLLDVICRTTGMGFAAVARVTDTRWITCGVLDLIQFGLKPGDELKLETTICNEIRESHRPVVIDHVAEDEAFANHHTPQMYGFQSYISIPIIRRDGSFFGTLCAIDPKPARLNTPEIIGMFNLFSDLVSFHLEAIEQLELSELTLLQTREEQIRVLREKNAELQKVNLDLQSFARVVSHDLQEPLRKIHTFSDLIFRKDYESLSADGRHYFVRLDKSVKRMQALVSDLILYTRVREEEDGAFELTELKPIAELVVQDFEEELNQKQGHVVPGPLCSAHVIPFQITQMLQNLIGNAVKFSREGVPPVISISAAIENGDPSVSEVLMPGRRYCHLVVSDNGIGFDAQYSRKIFEVFQRLNSREAYDGTGIGLSIVKQIVDNHHGFIRATSEIDKGARFDIYLQQPQTC